MRLFRVLSMVGLLGAVLAVPAAAAQRPVLARSVLVQHVSGTVLVREPRPPVTLRLTGRRVVPVGSTITTTHGMVRLTTSVGRRLQYGLFNGGAFIVKQHRDGLTDLFLTGGRGRGTCASAHRSSAAGHATASSPVLRLLHGHAHGRFRTVGHYAAATVRGTKWTTTDMCEGTKILDDHGTIDTASLSLSLTETLHNGESDVFRCLPPRAGVLDCLDILAKDKRESDGSRTETYSSTIVSSAPLSLGNECVTGPRDRKPKCVGFPITYFNNGDWIGALFDCPAREGAGDYGVTLSADGQQLANFTYHASRRPTSPGPCNVLEGSDLPLNSFAPLDSPSKMVNQYVLPTGADAFDLSVYLEPTGTPGKETVEGVIYADSGGRPGRLVGVSQPFTFTSSMAAQEVDMDLADPNASSILVHYPPGTYWMGISASGDSDVAAYSYEAMPSFPSQRAFNSNGPDGAATDPFGPFSVDDKLLGFQMFYSVSGT